MWSNEIRKRKVTKKKTGYNIVALERKTKPYGPQLPQVDNGKPMSLGQWLMIICIISFQPSVRYLGISRYGCLHVGCM